MVTMPTQIITSLGSRSITVPVNKKRTATVICSVSVRTSRTLLQRSLRRNPASRIAMHYLTAPRDDLPEHRAIRDAVLDCDTAGSGRLIREHFLRTRDINLASQLG